MKQKDQEKTPESPKCPDCDRQLEDKDRPCPDCSTKKPVDESSSTKRRPSRRAILLASLVILAACLMGAVLLFMNQGDSASTKTAEKSEQQAGRAEQAETADDSQSTATKTQSLAQILETKYEQCQEQRDQFQHITGTKEVQGCHRNSDDGFFILLLVQKTTGSDNGLVFRGYNVWCKDELGRQFSIIRSGQFILTVASRFILGEAASDSVSKNDYLKGINRATMEEYEYLREQGLTAELVNACELEELRP